jgi:hypothetical protein
MKKFKINLKLMNIIFNLILVKFIINFKFKSNYNNKRNYFKEK